MKIYILLLGLLLLVACQNNSLLIEEAVFSQEMMAHSSSIGTMYRTNNNVWQNADHNCDATPSNCCASGYHMCTMNEMLNSGREIEITGTNRDINPAFSGFSTTYSGDVVNHRNSGSDTTYGDCDGWSVATTTTYRYMCTLTYQGHFVCQATYGRCDNTQYAWCCSP